MSNVLDAAVSFPAVIFTVTSIFLFGFWVVTTALGSGFDAIADLESAVETDVDATTDTDGATGILRPMLELLGVTGMPLLLGLNIMSIAAWASAMIAQLIVGDNGAVALPVGLILLLLALVIGRSVARAVGSQFGALLAPTPALRRRDFIGRTCTITTERVTSTFGQAEVRDSEGGSLIIQVRTDDDGVFAAGDHALIFDVVDDTGTFLITTSPELGS